MAVSDEVIIIAIGFAVNILVYHKMSRMIGDLLFMGLSISMMAFSTGNTFSAVGLMMLGGSIALSVHDLLTYRPRKKRG